MVNCCVFCELDHKKVWHAKINDDLKNSFARRKGPSSPGGRTYDTPFAQRCTVANFGYEKMALSAMREENNWRVRRHNTGDQK